MRTRLFFILGLFLLPAPAQAQDGLRFRTEARDVRERQLIAAFTGDGTLDAALPTAITEADLNNDGAPEWILRQGDESTCAARAECDFVIAGLQSRKPVVLGRIKASKIEILPEGRFGVRELAVYNDPLNDFKPEVFEWKPTLRVFAPYNQLLREQE